MSGIVSVTAFVAEQLKISVTPDLERKRRILEKLDGLENEYTTIFCRFILMWRPTRPLMQRISSALLHMGQLYFLSNLAK
jgi:hypothetical protein